MRSCSPRPAQPSPERAIPLSLPRSNGAGQSGDTIIASAIQFPLSIIYCARCTRGRRRRRWPNRFLSGVQDAPGGRPAGQSRAARSARHPRAPRSAPAPPAGADATGGPAVGPGAGPGLGRAASGPPGLSSRWAPAESHRCNVTWGAH